MEELSEERTSGIAYTKLPIAAPAGVASMLELVRKSIKLEAKTVMCRWIRVPGLCGRVMASSNGLLEGCVPFVTGAGLASAAMVEGCQDIEGQNWQTLRLTFSTLRGIKLSGGAEPRDTSFKKHWQR